MRLLLKAINLQPLYQLIGYQFQDKRLILNALTHRSRGAKNNERLEFLGDSVLNFVIAEALYQRYPESLEGDLSRLRACLVKGETLSEVARELSLGDYVQLGQGELKSGGFRRASILADCLEAMIAAVLLDSDFEACKQVILTVFAKRLVGDINFESLKDPKTQLQERLQSKNINLPEYRLIQVSGEQHNQIFEILCVVKSLDLKSVGKGTTRRKAEKNAAQQMLTHLT